MPTSKLYIRGDCVLKFFSNLETSIKLVIFFCTVILGFFMFTIKSYIAITKSLEVIQSNQLELTELNLYKDITIGSFIDKQYEKVLSGDIKDIKESDMQVLALYSQNLKLSSDIMYKINKIIETRKLVSIDEKNSN